MFIHLAKSEAIPDALLKKSSMRKRLMIDFGFYSSASKQNRSQASTRPIHSQSFSN